MSLLTDSTPEEVLGSGFLNRFMLVVEQGTTRVFPFPKKGEGEAHCLKLLKWLKDLSGKVVIPEGSEARACYVQWYNLRKRRNDQDHSVAEVTQRGPDHLLRLAMLIHLAQCNNLIICLDCFQRAVKLLAFFERRAPELVKAIHSTAQTSQTEYVVQCLEKLGGSADHSRLLRRVSSRLNSLQFKQVVQTLNESGRLHISQKGIAQFYILRQEEEGVAHVG